jgi:magnesium-transporting ATPase (P-type)
MIQSANVGVGIRGKEGLQASRAADFAIGEFRFLERLLLIHGRNNYRRISKLILHTMYKNVANQTVQFYFAFFCRFSGTSIQMGSALLLFNLLFATIPMFCHALFDKEVSDKKNLAFPELYREGQRDAYVNIRVTFSWVLNGKYCGHSSNAY